MNVSCGQIKNFVAAGQSAQAAVDRICGAANTPRGGKTPGVGPGATSPRAASSVNPTPLLNRKAVRNFLLERAAQLRPFNKFERVSQETLNRIDAELRARLTAMVQRLPSKGKTI